MGLTKFTTNRSIETGLRTYEQRIKDSLYIYKQYKDQFIERECPCCNFEEHKFYDSFYESYRLVKCCKCSTLYVNPCPSSVALDQYYRCANNLMNVCNFESRKDKEECKYIYEDRINLVKKLVKKSDEKPVRILEIGCSSGVFLEKLREIFSEKEILLSGIDLDRKAVFQAQQKGLDVRFGNFEQTKVREYDNEFDIVMHFELIEHLIFPREFLAKCRKLLTPHSGSLLFTTPNGEGLDNKAIGYNHKNRLLAHSIFPPMHLNSFNTRNIFHLLLDLGFRDIQISTPGKLDVDMLNVHDSDIMDTIYRNISRFSEDDKEVIQMLIASLNASSHMQVVANV